MPLSPGARFGSYEILAPIGAGGMGEVYRARDTRLGREVAIKVLPRDLAATPEVRARFEREARLISSLNHPNICTVHDVGHEGDDYFLVMELVEGESLAERTARGPLPTADVLRIGVQIADALDKAHRAGIVHRDLKPGNVMLAKSGAKLLDFGLARNAAPLAEAGSGAHSPTMSRPLTAEGTIVGTFQYMAPEQLEGAEADARTDIWALGCVLYEMATGTAAFGGKSQASLISSIMSGHPRPIAQFAPMNPPALERLVKACLEKEPDDRVQTAHDVKLQLQWIAEGGSQAGVAAPVAARRKTRERIAWGLVGALAVAAGALAFVALKPKPASKPVIFELTPPAQVRSVDLPRISPDGRRLAFNARDSSGVQSIWVRNMNSLDAQRLPGTEGATRPFWSPDSRFLAFFSGGKLYKIDVAGGPPIALCDAPRGADGSWGAKGVILFDGSTGDSVQSVPASGGVATGATVIDRAHGQTQTAWPEFLPDGRHFLYVAYGSGPEGQELRIGSLGSMKSQALGTVASRVEFASGHLLQVRNGVLLAQKFDPGSRKLIGDPFPIAQNVEVGGTGAARFSASEEGTLVYRASASGGGEELVWMNRRGERTGSVGNSGQYQEPALSPDGTQLAVVVGSDGGTSDIWIYDLERNLGSRFTFAHKNVFGPTWSPDGSRLAFWDDGDSSRGIYAKQVGGSGAETLLLRAPAAGETDYWSSDGRWLTYIERGDGTRWDIHALSFDKDSVRSVPVRVTPFSEYQSAMSPDGSLLAYGSTESGGNEVFVQAFPGPGGKWRISTSGGTEPLWRGDGKELYYLAPDRQIMAVTVTPGSPPHFSLPHELFQTAASPNVTVRNRY
ncbi:MAG: protein kinase domain-containing protein, partial [Hyphomicrobiales bacterium]